MTDKDLFLAVMTPEEWHIWIDLRIMEGTRDYRIIYDGYCPICKAFRDRAPKKQTSCGTWVYDWQAICEICFAEQPHEIAEISHCTSFIGSVRLLRIWNRLVRAGVLNEPAS
jgi:hypothetical protein